MREERYGLGVLRSPRARVVEEPRRDGVRMRVALLACLAVTASCGQPRPSLVLPAPSPSAPSAPGPFPRLRTFDAAALDARCEACHAAIAAEWRASAHRRAPIEPVFRSQFEREPNPICTGCHAPEATLVDAPTEAEASIGVACVTCHVVGDRILAAPATPATPAAGAAVAGAAPHDVTRTDALATRACGACHEFRFPEAVDAPAMQSTSSEHAASRHADHACADCHMPRVSGHRSHLFPGGRDEALVRSAIVIERVQVIDGEARWTLRPGLVGHAFPTGDVFRRLVLSIELLDRGGAVLERGERVLGRRFAFTRSSPYQPPRRVEIADERVGVAGASTEIRFRPRRWGDGDAIRWSLRYERVADPASPEGPAVIEGAVALGDGRLDRR